VDACHLAVAFEEPLAALRTLDLAGIEMPKVQLTVGLRLSAAARTDAGLSRLEALADDVWLHQVVVRGDDHVRRYRDLPDALAAARRGQEGRGEWRVHFHVPIFRERLGPLETTQDDLRALVASLRARRPAPHLEVETHTLDVLPEAVRGESVVDTVARELTWVLARW
jgi:hypothetical protein